MKYGIREICEVVLKAKGKMNVGKKIFYKNEPVITFDSLKTSTMEGAATTVYAQGGPGNARLIAWEGERTVTFTMEDALISTVSLAILTGADVIDATNSETIKQHITETIEVSADGTIELENIPYMGDAKEDWIYVMLLKDGEPVSEPYLFSCDLMEFPSGGKLQHNQKTYKWYGAKRKTNWTTLPNIPQQNLHPTTTGTHRP